MFEKLLDEHLEYIKKNYSNKNCMFVYKWFPNDFLIELCKIIPFVFQDEDKFVNWKIDLNYLNDNFIKLNKTVVNFENNFWLLLIEEAILFNEKEINLESSLGYKIIIIENDLYSYFPNQSNIEFNVWIEDVNPDDPIIEGQSNELLEKFYANYTISSKQQLIQYKDLAEEIERKNFFNDTINLYNVNYENYNSNVNYISITDKDIRYLEVLNNIYLNKLDEKSKYNFSIIKSNVLTENYIYCKILYKILSTNNIDSSFTIIESLNSEKLNEDLYKDYLEILERKFWYNDFRTLKVYKDISFWKEVENISQGEIIHDIISQSKKNISTLNWWRDILITAPTWAWKSIIFQLPALYLARKYKLVTIVISPLKSLMVDQIQNLKHKWITNVSYINSDLDLLERDAIIQDVKNWNIDILYLSPESLLSYDISYFIGNRNLWLLVIDEAHLVTTWWRDFRSDYWYLWVYINKIRRFNIENEWKHDFCVVALTATAVYWWEDDMVFETHNSLSMKNPISYIWYVKRDDISFNINPFNYEWNYDQERENHTVNIIKDFISIWKKIIVYFPYKSHINNVFSQLNESSLWKYVVKYYWSLNKEEKNQYQEEFKKWTKKIILATKAFWMWIDIDDIEIVYHHAPTGAIPDYVQEIWRAARKVWIKWIAKVDYNKNDLKYMKTLHGLSSVKQYQCKFVLEKLYQIYAEKNKQLRNKNIFKQQQNFLVSIEDFSYIFTDAKEEDLVNKIKSIFLVLENDLLQKYNYRVIIARPKQLFTRAYICINDQVIEEFKKFYWNYIYRSKDSISNKRSYWSKYEEVFPSNRIWKDREDLWDIYEIDLWKLWEDKYSNKSFPQLKKEFFDGVLFWWFEDKIYLRQKLSIELNLNVDEIKSKLKEYMIKLENVLYKIDMNHWFVSSDKLGEFIYEEIPNKTISKKLKEVILNYYVARKTNWDPTKFWSWKFLQERTNKKTWEKEYNLFDRWFGKVKNEILSTYEEMFKSESKFEKFIPLNDKAKKYLKIAYLIELLELGSYQLEGGQNPQIFIRLNDPYKIRNIKWKYTNSIVSNIERRHKRSIEYMRKFFESKWSTEKRWEFIEDYFLWKDMSEY